MNKDEKRLLRRQRLMDNKAYQTMEGLTRYMDRYYLDALIGVIPGWGDAIALVCVVPFVYFSSRVIKSVPLTLAVLNNALRDVLLGMIPFFVGGIWIWLTHIFYGLIFCITIIGIPFGKMHFRLAKLALSPFGKELV